MPSMPTPRPSQDQPPALTRTMPLQGEEMAPELAVAVTAADGDAPRFNRVSITAALQRAAAPASESIDEPVRFTVGDCLGIGASGQVYAVADRNLQRSVAIKIMVPQERTDTEAVAHLIHEARLTASLAHPNVLPVYDLDTDASGRTYFSMKQVEGRSLGDEIQNSNVETRTAAIATGSRIVTIFIGVAQALAYAHRQHIIHQDVKPDNIMLGSFGEVLVVDWGSAARLVAGQMPKLYGTPLYMSPEQARVESVDERSDVYCLGATLFHALALRPPTLAETPEAFWEKKRAGVIDPLSDAERQAAPVALLAICFKALAVLPADRYPDAQAMLQDLQAFQAGLAVSAHHDSPWIRLRRWHRRHGRAVWLGVLVGTLLLTVLALVYGQRVEAIAHWGRPQVVEDFSDDSWTSHWKVFRGGFAHAHSGIVSTQQSANILLYDRKFSGATAIEYDAEILPGNAACDISAVWCSDAQFSADGATVLNLKNPTFFQFGAYDGTASTIVVGEHGAMIAYNRTRPIIGRTYHVRAQIADDRIELQVDGQLVCSWTDPFAYSSGYVGLYGYYRGKNFRNVRIYSRGVARKVAATAIGDAFVQAGNLAEAANQFARVADSYPDSALGREAIFKQGLCYYRLGDSPRAFALWQPLRASDYAGEIALKDVDHLVSGGDYDQALAQMRSLYQGGDAQLRLHVALAWGEYMSGLMHDRNNPMIIKYLALHDQVFHDEDEEDRCAALAMSGQNLYPELIKRYPDQRPSVADAMLHLGREEEVLRDYGDQVYPHDVAAIRLGDFGKVSAVSTPTICAMSRYFQGRFAEVHALYPDERIITDMTYAAEGRVADALALPNLDLFNRNLMLANAGRLDELSPGYAYLRSLALHHYDTCLHHDAPPYWVRTMIANAQGLAAWRSGDHATARACFLSAQQNLVPGYAAIWDPDTSGVMFRCLAAPFVMASDATGPPFTLAMQGIEKDLGRFYEQMIRYQARYLLGEITEQEFLDQPCKLFLNANLLLVKGMRADQAGDQVLARTCYTAWRALPAWQRGRVPDPAWDDFISWRFEHFAAPALAIPLGSPAHPTPPAVLPRAPGL